MLSSLFGNKGKQKDGKLKSIQLAAAAAKKVSGELAISFKDQSLTCIRYRRSNKTRNAKLRRRRNENRSDWTCCRNAKRRNASRLKKTGELALKLSRRSAKSARSWLSRRIKSSRTR